MSTAAITICCETCGWMADTTRNRESATWAEHAETCLEPRLSYPNGDDPETRQAEGKKAARRWNRGDGSKSAAQEEADRLAPLTSICAWCRTRFDGPAYEVLREASEHRRSCSARPLRTGPTREQKLRAMRQADTTSRGGWARTPEMRARREAALDRITDLRTEGLDMKQIALRLNEEGIRMLRGGEWTHSSIWSFWQSHKVAEVSA